MSHTSTESRESGRTAPVRCTAVVPTVGRSPWLAECLSNLRQQSGTDLEILLVDQGPEPTELPSGLVDRSLRPRRNLGFAAANNLAFEAAAGPYVATVNDDALVEEGWLESLLDFLEAHPRAGAVQGLNLQLGKEALVDGGGIAWNRRWQAVQLGRDLPAAGLLEEPREVFGVSATAAVYRRSALRSLTSRGPFDEALGSYYEDVDLACRLRHAGHQAWLVPGARARHAGSASGGAQGRGAESWIYGNRHLVLARLLGRSLWLRWPLIWWRDKVDVLRALLGGDPRRALRIVAGWSRALTRLHRFAHRGLPLVPLAELERFSDPASAADLAGPPREPGKT